MSEGLCPEAAQVCRLRRLVEVPSALRTHDSGFGRSVSSVPSAWSATRREVPFHGREQEVGWRRYGPNRGQLMVAPDPSKWDLTGAARYHRHRFAASPVAFHVQAHYGLV